MDYPLTFQIAITDTEVLLRFDKTSFPVEVTGVERAYQQLMDAQRVDDTQLIPIASLQLHQRILALLRAPSHDEVLKQGH